MGIAENYAAALKRIAGACARAGRRPEEVTLVAVTKTVEVAAIREAFQAGVRHFGENRVQEAGDKITGLMDIRPAFTFHMVGHLQSNKAGLAAKLFDVIESVDSVKLARALNSRTARPLPVLLEVNVAGEAGKSGMKTDAVAAASREIALLERLKVEGLMTVAPVVGSPEMVRPVFRQLRELRDSLGLKHLSMGMTGDFEVAIEEGATMVRIGRAIFAPPR
ncbi:MAG: YggS family pyridoxal phosphate-dependent enzyme [Chloroflexi bacterium]|nr:YggS family pyridoxal phosphate-dependent enzyme [Chloroflexota bacterium]